MLCNEVLFESSVIIFKAANLEDWDLVQLLVDYGADINICDDPNDFNVLERLLQKSVTKEFNDLYGLVDFLDADLKETC